MPVGHLNISWFSVYIPVGASITSHKTFEVEFELVIILSIIEVVNIENNIWHINASIRFS